MFASAMTYVGQHGGLSVAMAQAGALSADELAERAGAHPRYADRLTFDVALVTQPPDEGYDLVCFFDALHDMSDPVAALVQAREALAENGTVMLIEPLAGDRIEDNINLVAACSTRPPPWCAPSMASPRATGRCSEPRRSRPRCATRSPGRAHPIAPNR